MNHQAMNKLKELLEALGGDPGENFSERGEFPRVLDPKAGLPSDLAMELYGTPPSPSVNYSSEPGASTEVLEAVFMSQYGMYEPVLGAITEMREMGDGEGATKQYLEIDPPVPPEELASGVAPMLATMSSRGYSVRPLQYGVGFRLEGIKKRDSRLDEAAWIVNEIGARFAYWPERELVRLVVNPANVLAGTGMFTGADGQRLFSTAHDYSVTSESYALPSASAGTTTYSNVTTGSGSGANKIYSNTAEAQADFHTARAAILSRNDAHGEPLIVEQPGGKWYAICGTTEPTTSRYLYSAFAADANPSDDSLRDTQRFGVNVISTQLMNGVGTAVSATEHADWILAYQAPGARPPLFQLEREALSMAYEADPIADVETWAWRKRTGVGYSDSRAIQFINAN